MLVQVFHNFLGRRRLLAVRIHGFGRFELRLGSLVIGQHDKEVIAFDALDEPRHADERADVGACIAAPRTPRRGPLVWRFFAAAAAFAGRGQLLRVAGCWRLVFAAAIAVGRWLARRVFRRFAANGANVHRSIWLAHGAQRSIVVGIQ